MLGQMPRGGSSCCCGSRSLTTMPSQTHGAWGGRRQSASQTVERGRHGKRKARKVGSRPVAAVVEAKVLASGSKSSFPQELWLRWWRPRCWPVAANQVFHKNVWWTEGTMGQWQKQKTYIIYFYMTLLLFTAMFSYYIYIYSNVIILLYFYIDKLL